MNVWVAQHSDPGEDGDQAGKLKYDGEGIPSSAAVIAIQGIFVRLLHARARSLAARGFFRLK